MGKPTICIGENKADLQSLFFLNPKFATLTVHAGLLDLVGTQIVGFLAHRLKNLVRSYILVYRLSLNVRFFTSICVKRSTLLL